MLHYLRMMDKCCCVSEKEHLLKVWNTSIHYQGWLFSLLQQCVECTSNKYGVKQHMVATPYHLQSNDN